MLIEECQKGIARLSTRVQDVTTSLPSYDQRLYSEGIKALSERIQGIRAVYKPKQRFAFKKKASGDATMGVVEMPVRRALPSVAAMGPVTTALSSSAARTTSSSIKDNLSITHRSKEHIILPAHPTSASTTIALTNLDRCMIRPSHHPLFTSLTINAVDSSLLVIPLITGPAHMSNMTNTTLILQCRQFRLHSCKDIDVYLHCSSRPIIEDCEGIRFAPLSEELKRLLFGVDGHDSGGGGPGSNHWDQVDDFKWIRADESSPNWRILRHDEMIEDVVWKEVLGLAEGEKVSDERVEEILRRTLPAERG